MKITRLMDDLYLKKEIREGLDKVKQGNKQ